MSKLRRFRLQRGKGYMGTIMLADPEGEWVRHEDVEIMLGTRKPAPAIEIQATLPAPKPPGPIPCCCDYDGSLEAEEWDQRQANAREYVALHGMSVHHAHYPQPKAWPHIASWMTAQAWALMFKPGECGWIELTTHKAVERWVWRMRKTAAFSYKRRPKTNIYDITCI